MILLLDTHTFLWFCQDDPSLRDYPDNLGGRWGKVLEFDGQGRPPTL